MYTCCCKFADVHLNFDLVHGDNLASLVAMASVWELGEEDEVIAARFCCRGLTQCFQDGSEKSPRLQKETFQQPR
jgi:hypothetical protein